MKRIFTIGSATEIETYPELPEAIDCWIFDPPYNIGYQGYDAKVNDRQSWEDYTNQMELCAAYMHLLTANGSLFMIHYPEATARLLPIFEKVGWKFKQWITWTYNSNIGHSKQKFTTASRTVLWMVKGDPYINIKATVQPYKNPNDKRIKKLMANGSKGTNHYDWWNIQLRKNVGKGYRGWANQLPLELIERIIQTASPEGGWVADLMAGSGTTLEAAAGRNVWLNDISEEALPLWEGLL